MKFALALYSYSSVFEDHGVKRTWYSSGVGSGARWTSMFEGARQMDLETALAVYRRMDDPMRKMGLVPVE